jgi:DNA invertase Pin-like site-specific DNA recombinase
LEQADSNISLDEQQHRIAARCTENRWNLERVYVDAGISGSTPLARRPEGAKLLRMVQPGDVVIAAKLDRMFRNALDALQTIQTFKRQRISLWLLDLGDVCDGANELIVTVLAAVAQHERGMISKRIKDAKANLRRNHKHQGGGRPFGFQFGKSNGTGRARELIPAEILALRGDGWSLMKIRDEMRARGFPISHQLVANLCARGGLG